MFINVILLIMATTVLSRLVLDRVTCNNTYQPKIMERSVMGALQLAEIAVKYTSSKVAPQM